jgi:SLOG in TRPM, prokaryote
MSCGSLPSPVVLDVSRPEEIATSLERGGVTVGRPVLVCVGGAAAMSDDYSTALLGVLEELIAPAVDEWSAAVVDGGTDSGVMRLIGQARVTANCGFPLIGVAAAGTLRSGGGAGAPEHTAEVEPHHTLILRVPGDKWGDETPWLSAVAGVVAGHRSSVTLMINGGPIALLDARTSLEAGRPLVVLDGSGRCADDIARARSGIASEETTALIAASPLTRIVDAHDPQAILDAITDVLEGDPSQQLS